MRKLIVVTVVIVSAAVAVPTTALGATGSARSLQGLKTVSGTFTVPDGWTQSAGLMGGTPILGQYERAFALASGDQCNLTASVNWTGLARGLRVRMTMGSLVIPAPNALKGVYKLQEFGEMFRNDVPGMAAPYYLGKLRVPASKSDSRLAYADTFAVLPTGALAGKVKAAPYFVAHVQLSAYLGAAARKKAGQSAACQRIASRNLYSLTEIRVADDILYTFTLS